LVAVVDDLDLPGAANRAGISQVATCVQFQRGEFPNDPLVTNRLNDPLSTIPVRVLEVLAVAIDVGNVSAVGIV
jgi:hypothetical protein